MCSMNRMTFCVSAAAIKSLLTTLFLQMIVLTVAKCTQMARWRNSQVTLRLYTRASHNFVCLCVCVGELPVWLGT